MLVFKERFYTFQKIFFQAIDKDSDGALDLEEFIDAYKRRAEILKRQDAIEQKKKLYCLIIYGPVIQKNNDECLRLSIAD